MMGPVKVITAAVDGAVAAAVAGLARLRTARRRLDSAFCGYATAAFVCATPATNGASGRVNYACRARRLGLASGYVQRTSLAPALHLLLAAGAPGARVVASDLAADHSIADFGNRGGGGVRVVAGHTVASGAASQRPTVLLNFRLTIQTRGVYCATLMTPNTHTNSFRQARPTALACVTSGCLKDDRPGRACALGMLGRSIDSTD